MSAAPAGMRKKKQNKKKMRKRKRNKQKKTFPFLSLAGNKNNDNNGDSILVTDLHITLARFRGAKSDSVTGSKSGKN